ncbi:HCP-like protein, partial [Cladochytrium replicatum]
MEYAKNRLKSRSGADTDEIVEAATFLLDHVQHAPKHLQKTFSEASIKSLKRLSDREGLPEAQYYLARLYLRGIPGFEKGHKPDLAKAFSFLLSAAKKEHAEGTFLLALMFEIGAGTPASTPRALQHYRKAAVSNHPGAMYRLGMALLRGEMGMGRNTRDGVKWIKLSAKYADERYPHGLYELAMLHDKGVHNYVWTDHTYLVKCLTEAATLGHLGSQLKLGEAYEYGHFGVRVDPARSVYFYALAAGKGSAEAIFEIGGWYLTGADDATSGFRLERSHREAFRWAKKAADLGLARAMHAVGYFYETGVGVPSAEADEESKKMSGEWYRRAAERGDAKAAKKIGKGGK